MKKYRYSLECPNMWASFDHGVVFANNLNEAFELAKTQLLYDVNKVNEVLDHSENTRHFKIEININDIAITETEMTFEEAIGNFKELRVHPTNHEILDDSVFHNICEPKEATAFSVYGVKADNTEEWVLDAAANSIANKLKEALSIHLKS